MTRNIYSTTATTFPILRKVNYRMQSLYGSISKSYQEKNEWGKCVCCGNFTRFEYTKVLDVNTNIAQSCEFDETFTEVVNITNTLICSWCSASFRVRCPAESLLKFYFKGKIRSIKELVKYLKKGSFDWTVLETESTEGVFTNYKNMNNIIHSEYYDDVDRGDFKDEIRSEDLQNLTFDSNSFDVVISLDVFEHIADPWKAFSEVNRVLKSGGIGIITVPIDIRNQTTTSFAKIENRKIIYLRKPAYHGDPLREDGALVFTEFGTDIVSKLREMGYNASIDTYKTKRTNIVQLVILLQKSYKEL